MRDKKFVSFAKGIVAGVVIVCLAIGVLVGGCVAVAGAADDVKAGTDGYVTIDQVVKKNSENISALDKRVTAIEEQLSKPTLSASEPRLKMPSDVSSEIVDVTVSDLSPVVESSSGWAASSPPVVVSSGGWGAGNVSGGSTGSFRKSWSSSRVSGGSTGNVPIVRYFPPVQIASPPVVVKQARQVYTPPPVVLSPATRSVITSNRPAPATPLRNRLRSSFIAPATNSCRIVNGVRVCN